ncbi:MAG: aminotransferase class I/II-fold pyridoxal phosphate-dependent enzyme [Phycisphaerales bacterium]
MRIASRLAGFGTTVFAEITALANQHGAINLGQGFPDFDGPEGILDAAERAMRGGHNQYAPLAGIPALREAIAARWAGETGLAIDPDREVTVTAGATEAIPAALLGLVEPGDEVVVFEPYYDSYPAAIAMAGGVPRFVTLHAPEFRFDEAELRAAFSDRTRAVLVNTPHNPTGRVLSRDELEVIAELAAERGAVVISDEVYDRLVFRDDAGRGGGTGRGHVSIASLPGMSERTITINSLGKTYSLTGWKIGWAIAPPPLTAAVRAAHQFLTFAVATPLQHAAVAALALGDEYDRAFVRDYTERRALLCDALEAAGFGVRRPEGTFFAMARFDGVAAAPREAKRDDVSMARWLIETVGIACIPPSAFYAKKGESEGRHWLRFSFAKRVETLERAIERLSRLRG